MRHFIDRASHWLSCALLVVGCGFLLLMMLHISADVLLRYLWNNPLVGTLETVSYYYMVAAVFLPLAYTERSGEQIQVDLLVGRLPQGVQLVLYVIACLLGLIYFGALAYQSFWDAWESTVRLETIMSNFLFYIWPSRWALPVGLLGICLAILAKLLNALAEGRPR